MALMKQANAGAENEMMSQSEEGEENLTPEEEKQIDDAMAVAMVIIHGEGEQGDSIANLVLDNQDVAAGIGDAISTVLIATGKQFEYSEDLKVILAMQIFMELTTLAVEGGALSEDEVNDDFIDQALSRAYSSYLTTKEAMGELDPEELQQSVDAANQEAQSIGMEPKASGASSQQSQQAGRGQGLMQRAAQPGAN